MSIAVYTCITGNYEKVQTNQVFDGADFFLFTSSNYQDSNWKCFGATKMFANPRRNARYHKLLPHVFFPSYDYHIWIDGSVEVKVPVSYMIDRLNSNNSDILTFKHPVRICPYEEAKECIRLKLDDEKTIEYHVNRLKSDNYPENNGLAETKVVIRKNTRNVERFNTTWFCELMTGTLRDQISFNYAAWKTGVKVSYMEPIVNGESEWFTYHKHKRINLRGEVV
jgi:hypothetical protein